MKHGSLWRNTILFLLLAVMLLIAVPAKEASASGCGRPVYYTIRCGDTLSGIAFRFGVNVWQLARMNGIPNPNRIYAGRTIVIYPGCCTGCGFPHHGPVYIVRCGDTLWRIARIYGTTPWAIARANGIANPNYIWVGQRLVIP